MVTSLDAASPMYTICVQTYLVSFGGIDPVETKFHRTDSKCVAITIRGTPLNLAANAGRAASGAKRMARPVGKWFLMLARTVCTNVSGLSAMPLAKMEIRAFRSS